MLEVSVTWDGLYAEDVLGSLLPLRAIRAILPYQAPSNQGSSKGPLKAKKSFW